MMNFRVLVSCFALLLLGGSTASASVTITSGQVYAAVRENYFNLWDEGSLYGTANPFATATLTGSLSTTQRTTASQSIRHEFEHLRTGAEYDYAFGAAFADFYVDADTTYSLFGDYTNSSGYASVYVSLFNLTTGEYLFHQYDQNYAVSSHIVTLDMTSGWTGILLAGNSYRLNTEAGTFVNHSADDGATASGSFTIQFGDPAVEIVPEPASIAVWSCLGLGAVGMTWVRRRKVLSSSAS
jgi:hypothetical protein